jgi:hypothetical protein
LIGGVLGAVIGYRTDPELTVVEEVIDRVMPTLLLTVLILLIVLLFGLLRWRGI